MPVAEGHYTCVRVHFAALNTDCISLSHVVLLFL